MKEQVWYLDDGTTRPVPVETNEPNGYCVRLQRNGDFFDLFVLALSDMPKDYRDHVSRAYEGDRDDMVDKSLLGWNTGGGGTPEVFTAYVIGGSGEQAIATAKARLSEWISADKWPE